MLQAYPVDETYYTSHQEGKHPVCAEISALLRFRDKIYPITFGTSLPFYNSGTGKIGNEEYWYEENVFSTNEPMDASYVAEIALKYLNAPYLWGGKSIFGIDCSGFVQQVFKIAGYQLQRDAYQQAEQGKLVQDLSNAQTADLAFFERDNKIIHVGIILDDNRIIHARGNVRIDKIDDTGIIDEESNTYSHYLKTIKRIV